MTACPCQSGRPYSSCCQPLHQGQSASSPEALMRSRYSAFALRLTDYLQESWHPQTRPASLTLDGDEQWLGLEIVSSTTDGDQGRVHFRATCRDNHGFSVLEEQARFENINGHWCYRDGDHQVRPLKPGRNDPCPCGSGKKFKKCCG
ncbi:MAG: YchJ family protein [Alcanivorax sp.]|nr:YchJ family protein [Alcanivorax sp.]